MSNTPDKAIVVGAGFGGLASAIRLIAKGYEVTLIDRMPKLGGRAQVFERNGYIFDAGPTVVTAPFLFEELFQLFDKKFADYVKLVECEPWYRFYFSPTNETFDYGGSLEHTLAEIRKFDEADADGYLRLVDMSKQIFDKGFTELSDVPFDSFWFMMKQVPALIRLKSYKTVWKLICDYIKNPYIRQAFSLQPLLVGGNPFDTTSIYSLIHFLERKWGVHFAMGGTGAIVSALGQLIEEEGGTIKLETSVDEILVKNGQTTGVRLDSGETLEAKVVVVNGDPPHVYKHMIAKEHRSRWSDRRIDRLKYSMGLYVLYFGTNKKFENVAHHTIWLGKRYKELLNDIFHRKVLADDFSLYLHRPTATDPSMAPEGHDTFYVLSPVPNLQGGQDWNELRQAYGDKILKALEDTIMPGLSESVTERFDMTPNEFKSDYLTMHGTGFSIAPIFQQSAWFRFHDRPGDIKNLYFAGAGTHPGAGMPGVLCSAKIIDKVVPAPTHKKQSVAAT